MPTAKIFYPFTLSHFQPPIMREYTQTHTTMTITLIVIRPSKRATILHTTPARKVTRQTRPRHITPSLCYGLPLVDTITTCHPTQPLHECYPAKPDLFKPCRHLI